ncbi:MAG: hypothetical protein R3E53_22715 [Myxococcota bacterium]
MVYTLVTIVGCDAGAYFAGRAWGASSRRRSARTRASRGRSAA